MALTALLILGCVGCAFDVAKVKKSPTQFTAIAPSCGSWELAEETRVKVPSAYDRVLRAGTTWRQVGDIPEGQVHTTRDQVLTLEMSNVYEAYLVLRDGQLVGLYLPAVESYSPVHEPTTLRRRIIPGPAECETQADGPGGKPSPERVDKTGEESS